MILVDLTHPAADDAIRAEMHAGFAELRGEIRKGDEETRRQMRVLHEEVIERIKLLDEALNGRRGAQAPHPAPKRRSSRRLRR